jgi:uncharacterized membrane protein YagU involved in acid resistance
MDDRERNRWRGFVLGGVGGAAGVVAMSVYWKASSAVAKGDPRKQGRNSAPHPLDWISLVGRHHEEGESTTAAAGRIMYRRITGRNLESQETRHVLSYLVHWVFSMLTSGIYGAIRSRAGFPDVKGGLSLAIGLWLFGDELVTPLLGLAKGPTAYPLALHAHGLGAHVAYGLASSAATQLLQRVG